MTRCGAARRWSMLAQLSVLVIAGTGCGDHEERALCPRFDDVVARGLAVRDGDRDSTSAGEEADLVEAYLQAVTHLQEVADGRYAIELDQLESAVDDLLRTLRSAPKGADQKTWEPLVVDSFGDVATAAQRVEQNIEPTCSSVVTDG